MKHIGLKGASFASVLNTLVVLSPLAGFAAGLAGALPARGADVPFTEHVISTSAAESTSVFATDLDGDGDIDLLSAAELGDNIAWYENDGTYPFPNFTERVVGKAEHLSKGANPRLVVTSLSADEFDARSLYEFAKPSCVQAATAPQSAYAPIAVETLKTLTNR